MENSAVGLSNPVTTENNFRTDVIEGLSSPEKHLKSKYFYDTRGDELFQQIMALPEYYLTRCELEILSAYKSEILDFIPSGAYFHLIDLGAGDAFKTKILLNFFQEKKATFTYVPIDISPNVVNSLLTDQELKTVVIEGICSDYYGAFEQLKSLPRKLILFLGSNIGNFSPNETRNFLKRLAWSLNENDRLIIGFDLQKDPEVILAAYNDKAGVTRDFNLNLLHRINRELGANFDTEQFEHRPVYDAKKGEALSYLVSKRPQAVTIPSADATFYFKKGEAIHTEISRKYSTEEIERLAEDCGFEVLQNLFDQKKYFTNSVWKIKTTDLTSKA
jgi:L-histidine Nalpha-methyltransferase